MVGTGTINEELPLDEQAPRGNGENEEGREEPPKKKKKKKKKKEDCKMASFEFILDW